MTLAFGMAHIMTQAMQKFTGAVSLDGVVKYWYHFSIMFKALFILTTIDTGTRIARFLVEEIPERFYRPFGVVDWMPGVLISSFLVLALPQNLSVQTRSKPSLHQQTTAFLSENIKVGSHFQFRDGFFRHELLRPMGA